MIARLVILLKRRLAARKLGLRFERAASFEVPTELKLVHGTRIPLELPGDAGTKTAFVDVLLDDCYGLWSLPDDVTTVADIGCHAGIFSIAAKIRWPGAMVHSYDPNPAMQPFWFHHASIVGFQGYAEAVGFDQGTVKVVPEADSVQTRAVKGREGTVRQTALKALLFSVSRLVEQDGFGIIWARNVG